MRNAYHRSASVRFPSVLAGVLASAVAALAAGCKDDSPKPVPPPMAAPSSQSATPAAPPAAGGVAAATAPAGTEPVSGTVAETMDAASYTYLRITTAAGDKWAAVPQVKVAVGEKVTILNPMVMTQFASPTLKRSFPEILFGTLAGRPGPGGGGPAAPLASAAAAPVASGPVTKVADPAGRTVAEIFAGKAGLKDKTVAVRGRVTKYNAGILGHNWLHIADGTGSKGTGDDDLAVTTQGEAAVGDVVVVRGPLHLDRDFGSGYSYAVLVEDATIEK